MKKIYITLIFFVLSINFTFAQQKKMADDVNTLSQAIYSILYYYVDTVDSEKLTETAITAMLKNLDPHSTYIPPAEVQAANEGIQGSFEGVGIQYQMLHDTLYVTQTIDGAPAEKVGLLPGDRIIQVDTTGIAGNKTTTKQLATLLRGPKGTQIAVL